VTIVQRQARSEEHAADAWLQRVPLHWSPEPVPGDSSRLRIKRPSLTLPTGIYLKFLAHLAQHQQRLTN